MVEKKKGRPKTKEGKRIIFNLSYSAIRKLNDMTLMSRNKSKFIEMLIDEKYSEVEKTYGKTQRT